MRRRFISIKGFTETFEINNYLTIEALEDGLTISFENDIEYGIDGKGWIKLKKREYSPKLKAGQTISFKGKLNPLSSLGVGTFTISHKCNLLGNVMSLLFEGDAMKQKSLIGYDYAFYLLFYKCPIINTSSSFLPATTLAERCYYYMFYGCSSLTKAPELPATTLAERCYYYMFYDCSSLTKAPELPATTLADYCYASMFEGCTSLTTAPKLPATTLADYCYASMFYGCSSLTKAPELPATTLAERCYYYMFRNCTKLNYIKMLAVDISADRCLYNWVNGVASSGTFVKNKNATWNVTGASGVPSGWTIQKV